MWRCLDEEAFEPMDNVGSDLEEWVVREEAIFPQQPEVYWGRPGTLKVDASFVCVQAAKIGPQRRARYEDLSPHPTHVRQRYCDLFPEITVPVIRNGGENVWGEPADWGESVLVGSCQTADLQDISSDSGDLEWNGCKHPSMQFLS
jgi:hypothetical protein